MYYQSKYMVSYKKPWPEPEPGQSHLAWLGLDFFQARATLSQAKAMAFRPGQSRHITSTEWVGILMEYLRSRYGVGGILME
jgi:hypothetical protein